MKGCAEWCVVRCRWEDGDVEGVILRYSILVSHQEGVGIATFLPITPRQAMEGMVVIVGFVVGK